MAEQKDTIVVRANVEMTSAALKAIVENSKKLVGPDEKGIYRVDTAEKVGEMVSRFLLEHDFERYAKDFNNYEA
jgi:hypothetical protein